MDQLPPVAYKPDHVVLYKMPTTVDSSQSPHPYRSEGKWDPDHVRMPYDPQSKQKNKNEKVNWKEERIDLDKIEFYITFFFSFWNVIFILYT